MMNKYNILTERKKYIDVAKGILIISVVIGHVISFEYIITATIKTFIYTFHIPAFFIISGILINPNRLQNLSFKEFVSRKIKRLIIPYILFELIGGIFQIFLYGSDKISFVGILYGLFTMHCNIGADWFLPTLFVAELLFYIMIKKKIEIKLASFVTTIFIILAFILPDLNYAISIVRRIFIAFVFIAIGYILKKLFINKSKIGLIISLILTIFISYFNEFVDLASRTFNNPILYLLGGIVGTYFIIDFSQYVFGRIENFLAAVGRDSLVIMGTHQHIMLIANMIYGSVYPFGLQILLLPVIIIYEFILLKIYHLSAKILKKLLSTRGNNDE